MRQLLLTLLLVVYPLIAVGQPGVVLHLNETHWGKKYLERIEIDVQGDDIPDAQWDVQEWLTSMGWYNVNWRYRKKITIDSTKVPGDLTNFPVYVNLANLGSDFFSNVKSDGGDIRITKADGTTELPRELVSIDTTGQTGELWFKADALSSSANTDFYIYYGNSGASNPANNDTFGKYNVWDSNYIAVYHLNENPAGTAPQIKDSTANQLHGTSNGSMTSGDLVDAKLGKGLDFDGSNDYIGFGTSTLYDVGSGSVTVSAWIKNSMAGQGGIAGKGAINTGGKRYLLGINPTGNKCRFQLDDNVTDINTESTSDPTDNVWHYGVGVRDGGTSRIYFDGSQEATADVSAIGNIDSTHEFVIGAMINHSNGAKTNFYTGLIDEVRVSKIARSANWIATEYNNQNSPTTFYTVGSQEQVLLEDIVSLLSLTQTQADLLFGAETPLNLFTISQDKNDVLLKFESPTDTVILSQLLSEIYNQVELPDNLIILSDSLTDLLFGVESLSNIIVLSQNVIIEVPGIQSGSFILVEPNSVSGDFILVV